MLSYVMANKLLGTRQFCYKKGQNIQTALLNFIKDFKLAIEKWKITIFVLFDFSKEFDYIPHKLLLQKLRKMGITGKVLKWFFNYLQGRAQSVKSTYGTPMGYRLVAAGVHQGSALDPVFACL